MPNITLNSNHLTTGDTDHFEPKLIEAINSADKIDIAASFIRKSGLERLASALTDALRHGTKLRILTGDYLKITDPPSLSMLMVLKENGAEIRIFESGNEQSFHPKVYIFKKNAEDNIIDGITFIGSSNISRSALLDGIEWNIRIDYHENKERFLEIANKYDKLFYHTKTVELTYDWIEKYKYQYQSIGKVDVKDTTQPPEPNEIQKEALIKLDESRRNGDKRGLVVLATGLGKTWLAAFDIVQACAKRILFVAHREEILTQAEETFIKIKPYASVGKYTGKEKLPNADIIFASIQTLGKIDHLRNYDKEYFDYIIIDEFHHAATRSYQKLIQYFSPKYLLGLTATPDRTDQVDILEICDGNLIYSSDLMVGINLGLLCPFLYFGIHDKFVDYSKIKWSNNEFDKSELEETLSTQQRAQHVFEVWEKHKQSKTLAFCVRRKHAEFMADYFIKKGVSTVAVHSESRVRRNEALRGLELGRYEIIFSVDLFNEGIDLPVIDTILMLRPTESKILFLQQFGRGLRVAKNKSKLNVIDFIGNHKSFLRKPEALFGINTTASGLAAFLKDIEQKTIKLPPECYVYYDLGVIEFMKHYAQKQNETALQLYIHLKETKGGRPTATEMFTVSANFNLIRNSYGSWLEMVDQQGDLNNLEKECLRKHIDFFREQEISKATKSFKFVTLEALIENNGFIKPLNTKVLALKSTDILERRINLRKDIESQFGSFKEMRTTRFEEWHNYWLKNPINALIGGNSPKNTKIFFYVDDDIFQNKLDIDLREIDTFHALLQELIDYRLYKYAWTKKDEDEETEATTASLEDLFQEQGVVLNYYPALKIACGHFKEGYIHDSETRILHNNHGTLDTNIHFITRATGNSMNGGKKPIKDGDYLLLERIDPLHAGSISNEILAIEMLNAADDGRYLLRYVKKEAPGKYILVAQNKEYEDIIATEEMHTLARLKEVLDPLEVNLHQSFMREAIPQLFGLQFNPGLWNSGYICPTELNVQILMVTLNKAGKELEHRFLDKFANFKEFHWQSQNSTTQESNKGQKIKNHQQQNSIIHLFVRKEKLYNGKAAAFYYCGQLIFKEWYGSAPINITFELKTPLSKELGSLLVF